MNMPRKSKGINRNDTDDLDVTFGAFHLGGHRVPFMSAVLPFNKVADYLNLVTDDPKYASQDWSIEELFQREVDQGRVLDIVKSYLNNNDARPKFFNSLTVVLADDVKEGDAISPPPKQGNVANEEHIGPITLAFDDSDSQGQYPRNCSFGSVRWNRDQVKAVAIDGQHRLASIKEYSKSGHGRTSDSSVSVIFLIFSGKAGFVPEAIDQQKVMRSLFIDLNKHAVPVSRARNLLLDDLDPSARFLRSLIGPKLGMDNLRQKALLPHNIGESGEFDNCVPLNLVDWHGESKSKIDSGPYVASVLSLDWLVQQIFEKITKKKKVPAYFDPDDDAHYEVVEKTLKTWRKTYQDKSLGIEDRLTECSEAGTAFSLTHDDIRALTDEFNSIWGRAITQILCGLGGYRELVNLRVNGKSITPEFGQWYQALEARDRTKDSKNLNLSKHYDQRFRDVEDLLRNSGEKPPRYQKLIDKIDDIKRDSIFFLLVGQRAVFLCLLDLCAVDNMRWKKNISFKSKDSSKLFPEDSPSYYYFYSWMITTALNAYYDNDNDIAIFLRTCQLVVGGKKQIGRRGFLWSGSLVSRDDPERVDFSKAAAIRGSKVLGVLVFLYWFLESNKRKGDFQTNDKFYKLIEEHVSKGNSLQEHKFGKELEDALKAFIGPSNGESKQAGAESPIWNLSKGEEQFDFENSRKWALARVKFFVDCLL